MHVSGSCDPGYYSPSECPLGQCRGSYFIWTLRKEIKKHVNNRLMPEYFICLNQFFSDYASDQCYSNTECGPGKFCTEDDCQDQCPPGICLRELLRLANYNKNVPFNLSISDW